MSDLIDSSNHNDNRNYSYSNQGFYQRREFPIICDWINEGAKVIDLGCGNGSLMKYILDKKKVNIEGIEVALSGVDNCVQNGLKVRLGQIDRRETYTEYADGQFDFAVCNVTLQMVMYPEVLLREMKRIAKFLIISFPNFGYLSNRLELLIRGRMPRPMLHRYKWFNTGHIHQLTVKDFEDYCGANGIIILQRKHLGCLKFLANLFLPNLFSKEVICLCKKR